MSEAEWRDITVVGGAFEEQIDIRSDRRRHRPLRVSSFEARNFGEVFSEDEWRPGPAPRG